jgi:hypothetical protein
MYIGKILEERPIPMEQFDPMALPKLARRHLETIREPRRRQILENFIEHAEAEATGDHEALMASCSKKRQQYAVYGAEFAQPQSYPELEQHYRGLIEANLYLIHFETEKLVVGDDVIFIEGIVHQLYPGSLIEPLYGIEIGEPDAVYQLTKRTALTFVFDEDGKGAGEHAYSVGPTVADDLSVVPTDQVPAAFYRNPLTS